MTRHAARLRHVYWIGGGSGGGKSTIARHLGERYGLRVYATDDVMAEHARRSTPEKHPFLASFMAMDMDERWLRRSPATMLDTFHWYRGEAFDMIVDDLLDMPAEPGVVVEGFRLLPHLVKPLLAAPDHAVWLLPTPGFRSTVFESRGFTYLARTSDPERGRRNVLERDRMFTDRLREETGRLGMHAIEVDGTGTVEAAVERVAATFGLPPGGSGSIRSGA